MALRTGHGNGRGIPRIETLPLDELPPASPPQADRNRGPDGRWTPGNDAGTQRKLRPGIRGRIQQVEDRADPLRRAYLEWGKRYATALRRDLVKHHGGKISTWVAGLVESSAEMTADAKYLRAKSVQTGDDSLIDRAERLRTQASGLEARAWEYAAKEAAVRGDPDIGDILPAAKREGR